MQLGNEKGIKTSQWFPNEILHNEDLDFLSEQGYLNITDLLALLAEQGKATGSTKDLVIAGLLLEWNNLLTSDLRVGAAVSYSGSYFVDSEWGFQASAGEVFSVVVAKDQAVAVDAGGAQARYDTVEIRPKRTEYNSQSRSYKDPITGLVTSSLTNTRIEYAFEFQKLKGTGGAGVAPTHTAGWIKVAEVFVDASASSIDQDDIKDVRDSDTWTTEADNTKYKEPFIGEKVVSSPTGGTPTSLDKENTVKDGFEEVLSRLKDLSGVDNNATKERHIDWGTGAGQVKAESLPHSIAEIFTTEGDIGVRGASIPERLAAGALDFYLKGQGAGNKPIYEKLALRNTGIKIGHSTRDSSGDQVIDGVGFRPSVIIFVAMGEEDENFMSWGFDDGTNHLSIMTYTSGTQKTFYNATYSVRAQNAAAGDMRGYVSAFSSDGFTITWIEVSTGSIEYIYLCLP